jgi:aryl-alcohol dehydrogenase-like predicted oxidoreductase
VVLPRPRALGRDGPLISPLGFGCGPTARLMVEDDEQEQIRAVRRALDLGISYFDTAASYGDGLSERHLGRALRKLGARPVIASKVTLGWDQLDDIAGAVTSSVMASLDRLDIPTVDVIHLHNRVGHVRAPHPNIGSGAQLSVGDVLGPNGVVEALERLRDRGLVGIIGCCGYGGETRATEEIIESGKFASILINMSLLNMSAWSDAEAPGARNYGGIAAFASARGMGIIALRVLEAGVLVGGLLGPAVATGREIVARRLTELSWLLEDGTQTFVEPALRFVLSNPAVSTAIIGFSDCDQIDAAVSAVAKGHLSQSTLIRLAALQNGN